MSGPVRKQPVDDHAKDGEQEDKQRPEELVRGRAVGFDDFDKEDDIQNQDHQADETTTRAVLPGISARGRGRDVVGDDRCGEAHTDQAELDEEGEECCLDHDDFLSLSFGLI